MVSQTECLQFQSNQQLALSYIYLDQYRPTKDSSRFSIICKPIYHQTQYQLCFSFEYPRLYPSVPPAYELEPLIGITRDNLQAIQTRVADVLAEAKGRCVVYQMVEEARRWVQQFLVQGRAYARKDAQEDEQAKEAAKEVFEKAKFTIFTPVTLENFLAWKKDFEFRRGGKRLDRKEVDMEKISGKEYFLGRHDKEEQEEQDEDDEEDQDEEEDEQDKPAAKADDQVANALFDGKV